MIQCSSKPHTEYSEPGPSAISAAAASVWLCIQLHRIAYQHPADNHKRTGPNSSHRVASGEQIQVKRILCPFDNYIIYFLQFLMDTRNVYGRVLCGLS